MQFEVTILGSNGAVPAFDRHPSSQVLNYNGDMYMLDCGEGTQFRMSTFSIKRGRLDNIFITHLHGDHFYGLIGLLTSFNLNWRDKPLHLYAPEGLKEIIEVQLKHSETKLRYELIFHPIQAFEPRIILDTEILSVETIILKHRIATTGFIFREKKNTRNILPEKIKQYNIPTAKITGIKKGEDFIDERGNKIPNSELTVAPSHPRAYAYCTDTAYTQNFIQQIKGIDLLYHESTFLHDQADRAEETFHSTARQAAMVALQAGVKKLVIGHFSGRYENLEVLLNESREIFPETYLAIEGQIFEV